MLGGGCAVLWEIPVSIVRLCAICLFFSFVFVFVEHTHRISCNRDRDKHRDRPDMLPAYNMAIPFCPDRRKRICGLCGLDSCKEEGEREWGCSAC